MARVPLIEDDDSEREASAPVPRRRGRDVRAWASGAADRVPAAPRYGRSGHSGRAGSL
ncbi:hypothetical protein ATKI12_3909 [Kitasatospora sp. Ki12]|uniref:hypothetical protein n=1 Tax=Kitasatospora xanthocidica TaxID=83382 RepID=UPI001675810D|nr:hypothetical protein [Kitasatospora xanthocidica]GHF91225.1 hypothetical protein GCM10018790_80440 [Kitasatospora xanthocidica]